MPFLTDPITFNGEEARDYILEPTYNEIDENSYINFVPGIKAKKQLAFLGLLDKIVRKDSGCNTPTSRGSIARSEKFWNPEKCEAFWEYCAADDFAQLEVYNQASGVRKYDLTSNEELAALLISRHLDAMRKDVQRMYWLSDKSVVAGSLTNGASDVPDYDQLNGLWVRIATGVTGSTIPRYDITASQGSDLTDDNTPGNYEAPVILKTLYDNADERMQELPDNQLVYVVSKSIYQNLKYYYQSKGIALSLESGAQAEMDGMPSLRYNGIEVRQQPMWDRYIKADWAPGGTVDREHRAILVAKNNLAVGWEMADDIENFEMWYERKDKKTYTHSIFQMDTLIEFDHLVSVAY